MTVNTSGGIKAAAEDIGYSLEDWTPDVHKLPMHGVIEQKSTDGLVVESCIDEAKTEAKKSGIRILLYCQFEPNWFT